MADLDALKEDFLLLAALNGHFQARKAALAFRRDLSPPEERDSLGRELFGLRVQAEQAGLWLERLWQGRGVLEAGGASAAEQAQALSQAEALAVDLEGKAGALEGLLERPAGDLDRAAVLVLASALERLAAIADHLQKAYFTAAGRKLALPELQARLDQGPDTEATHQALRRWQELLAQAKPWSTDEAELLRRRCASAPGRLRLHALELRRLARRHAQAGAKEAGSRDGDDAEAWAAAGFEAGADKAWRGQGMDDPATALAWRSLGLDPVQAQAWSGAGLLPDDAASLLFAGAHDAAQAAALLKALGSGEQVLSWSRAGIGVDEVLDLKAKGAKNAPHALAIKQALAAKKLADAAAVAAPSPLPPLPAASPSTGPVPLPPLPGLPAPVPAPAPAPAPQDPVLAAPFSVQPLTPEELKAWEGAGVSEPAEAAAWRAAGFTALSAQAWRRAGEGPRQAGAWVRAGLGDPSRLEALRGLGLVLGDDLELLQLRAARLGLDPLGLDPAKLAVPRDPLPRALLYWGAPLGQGESLWSPPHEGEACPQDWLKRLRRLGAHDSLRVLGAVLGLEAEGAYAAASECGAMDRAVALSELDVLREWSDYLAGLAKALGLSPSAPPSWRLSGPAPAPKGCEPAVFWGLCFDEPGAPPWAGSMDYAKRESWPMRWSRRAEDLGFEDDAPTCVVGQLPSPAGPRYVVALATSLRRGRPGQTVEIPGFSSPARWKELLEDFCTVMDIPWKGPRWWLASADFQEASV